MSAQAEGRFSRLRVLAVDDHQTNRLALSLMLDPLEIEVSLAASGEEALEQLGVARFDLVLMDLQMPGIGGLEACRRLRAAPGPNQRTPVIACTGAQAESDWADCVAAGMDGRAAKPLEPALLLEIMLAAVSRAGLATAA